MEVTKGVWCQWYVTLDYLQTALHQLDNVPPQYVYIIVNVPPNSDHKNHLLIIYRNPPYAETK
jgi:hypothetical protein